MDGAFVYQTILSTDKLRVTWKEEKFMAHDAPVVAALNGGCLWPGKL